MSNNIYRIIEIILLIAILCLAIGTYQKTVARGPEATATPSVMPVNTPTVAPTQAPTAEPTVAPTQAPTTEPTIVPTEVPIIAPIFEPTATPLTAPIIVFATQEPTKEPTPEPTAEPTPEPTAEPFTIVIPENAEIRQTENNTLVIVFATPEPTKEPTPEPTKETTPEPTKEPTPEPTEVPTPEPTAEPTKAPAVQIVFSSTQTPAPTVDNMQIIMDQVKKMSVSNEVMAVKGVDKAYDFKYAYEGLNYDELFSKLSPFFVNTVAHSFDFDFDRASGSAEKQLEYVLNHGTGANGRLVLTYKDANTEKMRSIMSGISDKEEACTLMLTFLREFTMKNPNNESEILFIIE